MEKKLKRKFLYQSGTVEILLIDHPDGTPLSYVWFGTRKEFQHPTHDFILTARQAVALAKAILAAAKEAGKP